MRTSASGGASRESVVFPAPETPANRNARPFRTALAACTRKPPWRASNSECRMRSTPSIEYGFTLWRTQPWPFDGSHSARKSPRVMIQRPDSRRTLTSSSSSIMRGGISSTSSENIGGGPLGHAKLP